jgi:hypothetical protein
VSNKMLYSDNQISISKKYLESIVKQLSRPPCLLGGWAVFLQLNDKFNASKGRDYPGSKDIDLGFHLDPKWSKEEYNRSDLRKAIDKIQALGFEAVSFRFVKHFSEGGTELTHEQARRVAQYEMFPLYIDLLVDTDDERRHKIVGFTIAEELLLQKVFFEKRGTVAKFLDSEITMPDPSLLLEMKINSLPNRTPDDKRTKDLMDICALLLYSVSEPPTLSDSDNNPKRKEKFQQAITSLPEAEWDNVARILDEEKIDLKRVVARIHS